MRVALSMLSMPRIQCSIVSIIVRPTISVLDWHCRGSAVSVIVLNPHCQKHPLSPMGPLLMQGFYRARIILSVEGSTVRGMVPLSVRRIVLNGVTYCQFERSSVSARFPLSVQELYCQSTDLNVSVVIRCQYNGFTASTRDCSME